MSRSDSSTTLEDDRDPTYYFTTIIFRVEESLFRVPKHHFIEQSEVFRDMFELPVATDTVPDGLTDEQLLRLEGVDVTDFRRLLEVMFPSLRRLQSTEEAFAVSHWTSVIRLCALWQMDDLKKSGVQALLRLSGSREEWTALLDLSVDRQLPEVRNVAIQKLTPLVSSSQNAVDVVATARKYRVKSWLKTGLQGLIQRAELLSGADEKSLGWETVIKLCRLRESGVKSQVSQLQAQVSQLQAQVSQQQQQQYRSGSYYTQVPMPVHASHRDYSPNLTMESEFQDELKELDD